MTSKKDSHRVVSAEIETRREETDRSSNVFKDTRLNVRFSAPIVETDTLALVQIDKFPIVCLVAEGKSDFPKNRN